MNDRLIFVLVPRLVGVLFRVAYPSDVDRWIAVHEDEQEAVDTLVATIRDINLEAYAERDAANTGHDPRE